MGITIEIDSNFSSLADKLTDAAVTRAMTPAFRAFQLQAKVDAPVDTGRLMRSITLNSSVNEVRVFSNVEYAEVQDFRTGYFSDNIPFLISEIRSSLSENLPL